MYKVYTFLQEGVSPVSCPARPEHQSPGEGDLQPGPGDTMTTRYFLYLHHTYMLITQQTETLSRYIPDINITRPNLDVDARRGLQFIEPGLHQSGRLDVYSALLMIM